jgi:DNA topoisomerase VI subunit B
LKVKHEAERRNIFLRYLGEVAQAVSSINESDRDTLYEQLLAVAKKKTAAADMEIDEKGEFVEGPAEDFGDHVLIVEPSEELLLKPRAIKSNAANPDAPSLDAAASDSAPARADSARAAAGNRTSKTKKNSSK